MASLPVLNMRREGRLDGGRNSESSLVDGRNLLAHSVAEGRTFISKPVGDYLASSMDNRLGSSKPFAIFPTKRRESDSPEIKKQLPNQQDSVVDLNRFLNDARRAPGDCNS